MKQPRAYRRYFAVKNALSNIQSEIESDLYKLWLRYAPLKPDGYGGDGWPDDVEDITIYNGFIHVSGTWSRRGCTDRMSCSMPHYLVYADEAGREAYFADMVEKKAAAEKAKERAKEEAELKTYLALKAKIEGNV